MTNELLPYTWEVWSLDGRLTLNGNVTIDSYNPDFGKPFGIFTQARDRKLSMILNRAGSFSCTVPIDHIETARLVPYSGTQMQPLISGVLLRRVYWVRPTTVEPCLPNVPGALKRSDNVWSGFLQSVTDDLVTGKKTLNYIGWFERLRKRYVHAKKTYGPTDISNIVGGIITDANSFYQTGFTNALTSTYTATRTVNIGDNIADIIQQMSDTEGGYDFVIDMVSSPSGGMLTSPLNISVLTKIGTDKPKCRFGFGVGPENVLTCSRTSDGDILANYVLATGANNLAAFDEDTTSKTKHGVREDIISLGDVNSIDVLTAYAGIEVFLRKDGRVTWEFTPKPDDGTRRVPAPIADYGLGDTIYLSARRGDVSIANQGLRVFGIDIDIDDNGIEKVTSIKTSPG